WPPNTRSTARWTLPKQLIQGSRLWFWNTTARSGPGPSISRPLHTRPPALASSRPAIRLRTVDLPQPEWPISETNSPRAMLRLMSLRAWKRPFLVSKCLLTPVSSTNLSMAVSLARIVEAPGQPQQALFQRQADQADDDDGDEDVLDVE